MALRVVSEQSEANIRKQRIHDQLTRDLRKFAANFHRMTSGSGKPLDLLQQMEKVAVVPTTCFQCYFQQWVQCVAHRASPQDCDRKAFASSHGARIHHGGRIMGAKIRAQGAREEATKAIRAADRAEAEACFARGGE